ncbi:MAG: FadR/GntR family transcriptional regulator, partial [Cognatishimia sp.]
TQPLMNMITFSARSREKIIELHTAIADATEAQDPGTIERNLDALSAYTIQLGENVFATRKSKS